jgi:hypothetical protein
MPYLGFFWGRDYQLLLASALISALCLLVLRRLAKIGLNKTALKIVYGIIFLPILILPIFKCCFRIPYIFCRECPSKCPWGISRTLALGSFILLNLSGRFWCFSMCPFGTCQEAQARISKKNFQPLRDPHILSYPVLILTGSLYSLTLLASGLVAYFEIGHYAWVWTTVLTAALISAASFLVPKFWCRYLCPVGAAAELLSPHLPR